MADDRDPSGVPAERGYVFLNPLEEGDLVHHAEVGHARNSRWAHVGVEEALRCDRIRLIKGPFINDVSRVRGRGVADF